MAGDGWDDSGEVCDSEVQRYNKQARGEYEKLMKEFEFRCERSAAMYYSEAAGLNAWVFYVVLAGAVGAGIVSLYQFLNAVVGLQLLSNTTLYIALFIVCLCVGCLAGTEKLQPFMKERQQLYISAAATWQELAMRTRSYRIQMDNPKHYGIEKYAEFYNDLIKAREAVCAKVCSSQAHYEKFLEPETLFRRLWKKQELYRKFLELQDQGLSDPEDLQEAETLWTTLMKQKRVMFGCCCFVLCMILSVPCLFFGC